MTYELTSTERLNVASVRAYAHLFSRWAADKHFRDHGTLSGQLKKLAEELDELKASLEDGSDPSDDIGDGIVVCSVIAYMLDVDVAAALERQYQTMHGQRYVSGDSQISMESRINGLRACWKMIEFSLLDRKDNDWMTNRLAEYAFRLCDVADASGLWVPDCLETAWLDIRHRTGRMIDGAFVKQADLPA